MADFQVSSGAKVNIKIASFGEVMRFKNAIQKAFSKSGIKFELSDNISDLTQIVMLIDSDDDVFRCLFECLKKCTYNGEKITENTFEPEDARQDYYDIVIECLKVNFSPFLKGLASKWNTLSSVVKGSSIQKPE